MTDERSGAGPLNTLYAQWLWTISTALVVLIPALLIEQSRIRKNAGTRPYAVGMLLSLNALFNGVLALIFEFVLLLSDPDSASLKIFAFALGLVVAGILGIRRVRAGLIASVLLLFNPLWYIVGIWYIPRVWNELNDNPTRVEADGRVRRRVYRNMY